jgi:hypothetical protein
MVRAVGIGLASGLGSGLGLCLVFLNLHNGLAKNVFVQNHMDSNFVAPVGRPTAA